MAVTTDGHVVHEVGHDSMIDRNRYLRFLVLVVLLGLVVGIPTFIGVLKLGYWGGLAGLAIGAFGALWWLPSYVVTVPQAQVFVTLNNLRTLFHLPGDSNVKYGPGTSLSFPWETRDEKGNLTLEIITLPFGEKVPGKDTQLITDGSFQFKVNICRAERFVGIDQSTIQGGMVTLIRSKVSVKLAPLTADDAKANLEKINEELLSDFGLNKNGQGKDPEVSKFEEQYGIDVIGVTLNGIDVPESVQETRNALDKAAQVFMGVARLGGYTPEQLRGLLQEGKMTPEQYNELLDRFFVQSRVSDMKVNAFKLHGAEDISRFLRKTFGNDK